MTAMIPAASRSSNTKTEPPAHPTPRARCRPVIPSNVTISLAMEARHQHRERYSSFLSSHREMPVSYTGQTFSTVSGTDTAIVIGEVSNMLETPENKSDLVQDMFNELNDF